MLVFQSFNASGLWHFAFFLTQSWLERILREAKSKMTIKTEPPSENGSILAQADRVCFSTCGLNYLLFLKTRKKLRPCHSIFFIFAKFLNHVRWKTKLASLCASPAVDLVVFRESKCMQSTTRNLVDPNIGKGLNFLRNSSILPIILACLIHGSPCKQFLILIYSSRVLISCR